MGKFKQAGFDVILKSTLVLMCVALGCGILIAGVNFVTAPVIEAARVERIKDSLQEIFADMDGLDAHEQDFGTKAGKEYYGIMKDSTIIGYAYTASGSNQYGDVEITVGIDNGGKIVGIVFVNNGQSAGYNAKVETNSTLYIGVNCDNIESVSHAGTGATYGTTLLKELLRDVVAAYETTKSKGSVKLVNDYYIDLDILKGGE